MTLDKNHDASTPCSSCGREYRDQDVLTLAEASEWSRIPKGTLVEKRGKDEPPRTFLRGRVTVVRFGDLKAFCDQQEAETVRGGEHLPGMYPWGALPYVDEESPG